MSSVSIPRPMRGSGDSPREGPVRSPPSFSQWFPAFLRQELKPYPGRYVLTLRYVLAATLTMLIIMTFRIPGAATGGFYSLLLSRDAPTATLKGAAGTVVSFAVALVFVLSGTMLFIDYPLTHFLWVVGSLFVGFYAIAVMSNYAAASAFAILIALGVPAWDAPGPTAAIVVSNLWIAGAVAVALFSTVVVEFAFSLFYTEDQLEAGIEDRLSSVETYLDQAALGSVSGDAKAKIEQLAMVGVSKLRQLAASSNASGQKIAQRGTTVALVGRLVDIVASIKPAAQLTPEERSRFAELSTHLKQMHGKLNSVNDPPLQAVTRPAPGDKSDLPELERTAQLLLLSFSSTDGPSVSEYEAKPPATPFLVPDAWTNQEHLQFALSGCFAAVVCYFIQNAVAWPGLGSSLFTCVVTALTSIGASRQKQMLRISGALAGGVIFGMGSQVIILPMLDGIGSFTVLFVIVTSIAAWFMTASPRLSYFGSQMALGFFFIQLRGPFPQTSVSIARDNVIGILLGLTVMGVIFETFGSKPAVEVMQDLFANNLQLMAKLADPWPGSKKADLGQLRALREKISANFAAINAQADAVLFETGASRDESLELRSELLGYQPQLRSLFLIEVALLQYRAPVDPKTLPNRVVEAQLQLDHEMKLILETMAGTSRKNAPGKPRSTGARETYDNLCTIVNEIYQGKPTRNAKAVVALSSHLVETSTTLLRTLTEAKDKRRPRQADPNTPR